MNADFSRVAVIGAGTMGSGIAHVAAQAGAQVTIFEVSRERAEAGRAKIAATLEAGVQKGKVSAADRDATLGRLSVTDSLSTLAGAQLVIEAVPEDLALKQRLFREVSSICGPSAVLASNTSSLPVSQIAAAAATPSRVVGMHFFNPVHVMKLLELVRAEQTSDETMALARAFGERIRKEVIVVKDSPGFASSRLGLTLGLEAIRMVEQGVASAADIDRAMKFGYGHPMGPLELGDLVGLDVRLAIADHLYAETRSETFRAPELLRQMVREGKLGKKSGQGFYPY